MLSCLVELHTEGSAAQSVQCNERREAMPPTQRKGRLLLGVWLTGVVVFFALSGVTQLVASFRVSLSSPFVQALVVLAAVGTATVFLRWGRLPRAADRGAYVAAVLVMG